MEEKREMPVFDPAAIKEMDEGQIDEYGRRYTEAVEGYVRESIAKGLAPVIEDMDRRTREGERNAALLELRENEEYYDFAEKRDAAEKLIEGMPALAAMDARERYTAAYLMVKGAEALAARKGATERTPEQKAEDAWNDPEVMRLLMERRAKEAVADLPVFPGSSAGAVAVQDKPKTLADASARARKHFKL